MTRSTDADPATSRAHFEGRPLDRPDEELADQGAPSAPCSRDAGC